MRTDKIFYNLFQEFPEIFFELIGETNIDPSVYDFSSVELKETAFRIDGVLIPSVESATQPLYFLEVQFQADLSFYRRLFAELFIYLRQNEGVKFWRGVVVFRERSLEPDDTEAYQLLLEHPQVRRIYLDELGEAAQNSLGLGIVQLVVEEEDTAVDRGKRLISQARQQLTEELTQQKILDIIETILMYKFADLSREELQAMLGLDEFKQSRLYQDIKQDIQGECEMKAKLESVPRLLTLGLSVEQVAIGLNLTVEQVQSAIANQSN